MKFIVRLKYLFATALILLSLDIAGKGLLTPIPLKSTSSPYGYYEYLPQSYLESYDYSPMIIYLHGNEEKGNGSSDLSKILDNGIPKLIKGGNEYPFVILSPQSYNSFFNPETLNEFIDYATKVYRINISKIYITGIGNGGLSIWNYLASFPKNKLAAVVPIAGNGYKVAEKACEIKTPVWAFHGELDKIVNPNGSIGAIGAMQKCINSVSKLTLYPNTGHDCWSKTYNNSAGNDIFKWMLQFSSNSAKASKGNRPLPVVMSANPQSINEIGKLPAAIPENTGIKVIDKNTLLAIDRSVKTEYLYTIDTVGHVKAVKKVVFATHLSWEDITTDPSGNIYIADVGNRDNNRKNMQVYKIKNIQGQTSDRVNAEKIEFDLPDQTEFPPKEDNLNFDIQSCVYFNDSLYLFTKNRTTPFDGVIKLYRIPSKPGKCSATLVSSIYLGSEGFPPQYQISSAALSPDNKKLALLTSSRIWLFTEFNGSDFFKGKITQINLPIFSEKRALDFIDNNSVYFTDLNFRGKGANLYRLTLARE